jgi:hypothetical protein
MDYRIVPYIKKYLHEGHSLEQIRQSLVYQGVPDSDIKQAAIYAMDEGVKEIKKNNVALWTVPIILILIIAGAGYYFQNEIITFAKQTIEKSISTSPNSSAQQSTASCDMDCLIAVADTCSDASTEFNSEVDFFGMIIQSTNYYEIKPGERCGLYIKGIDGDIEFSQELKDRSLANGITEEELNLQLDESRKGVRANIGKEGICLFNDASKLKEFLEKTKAGTFSSEISCGLDTEGSKCTYGGDWALGECTGSMFSS